MKNISGMKRSSRLIVRSVVSALVLMENKINDFSRTWLIVECLFDAKFCSACGAGQPE